MPRTYAQLRQDVATRIAGLGGAWNEAPVAWDAHSWSGVPEAIPSTKAHLSYSVGITDSEAIGDRHRTYFQARTTVRVRFLARLSPASSGPLASVDAALDAEVALIKRLDSGWSTTLTVYYRRTRRSTAPSGEWIQIEAEFLVDHQVALT